MDLYMNQPLQESDNDFGSVILKELFEPQTSAMDHPTTGINSKNNLASTSEIKDANNGHNSTNGHNSNGYGHPSLLNDPLLNKTDTLKKEIAELRDKGMNREILMAELEKRLAEKMNDIYQYKMENDVLKKCNEDNAEEIKKLKSQCEQYEAQIYQYKEMKFKTEEEGDVISDLRKDLAHERKLLQKSKSETEHFRLLSKESKSSFKKMKRTYETIFDWALRFSRKLRENGLLTETEKLFVSKELKDENLSIEDNVPEDVDESSDQQSHVEKDSQSVSEAVSLSKIKFPEPQLAETSAGRGFPFGQNSNALQNIPAVPNPLPLRNSNFFHKTFQDVIEDSLVEEDCMDVSSSEKNAMQKLLGFGRHSFTPLSPVFEGPPRNRSPSRDRVFSEPAATPRRNFSPTHGRFNWRHCLDDSQMAEKSLTHNSFKPKIPLNHQRSEGFDLTEDLPNREDRRNGTDPRRDVSNIVSASSSRRTRVHSKRLQSGCVKVTFNVEDSVIVEKDPNSEEISLIFPSLSETRPTFNASNVNIQTLANSIPAQFERPVYSQNNETEEFENGETSHSHKRPRLSDEDFFSLPVLKGETSSDVISHLPEETLVDVDVCENGNQESVPDTYSYDKEESVFVVETIENSTTLVETFSDVISMQDGGNNSVIKTNDKLVLNSPVYENALSLVHPLSENDYKQADYNSSETDHFLESDADYKYLANQTLNERRNKLINMREIPSVKMPEERIFQSQVLAVNGDSDKSGESDTNNEDLLQENDSKVKNKEVGKTLENSERDELFSSESVFKVPNEVPMAMSKKNFSDTVPTTLNKGSFEFDDHKLSFEGESNNMNKMEPSIKTSDNKCQNNFSLTKVEIKDIEESHTIAIDNHDSITNYNIKGSFKESNLQNVDINEIKGTISAKLLPQTDKASKSECLEIMNGGPTSVDQKSSKDEQKSGMESSNKFFPQGHYRNTSENGLTTSGGSNNESTLTEENNIQQSTTVTGHSETRHKPDTSMISNKNSNRKLFPIGVTSTSAYPNRSVNIDTLNKNVFMEQPSADEEPSERESDHPKALQRQTINKKVIPVQNGISSTSTDVASKTPYKVIIEQDSNKQEFISKSTTDEARSETKDVSNKKNKRSKNLPSKNILTSDPRALPVMQGSFSTKQEPIQETSTDEFQSETEDKYKPIPKRRRNAKRLPSTDKESESETTHQGVPKGRTRSSKNIVDTKQSNANEIQSKIKDEDLPKKRCIKKVQGPISLDISSSPDKQVKKQTSNLSDETNELELENLNLPKRRKRNTEKFMSYTDNISKKNTEVQKKLRNKKQEIDFTSGNGIKEKLIKTPDNFNLLDQTPDHNSSKRMLSSEQASELASNSIAKNSAVNSNVSLVSNTSNIHPLKSCNISSKIENINVTSVPAVLKDNPSTKLITKHDTFNLSVGISSSHVAESDLVEDKECDPCSIQPSNKSETSPCSDLNESKTSLSGQPVTLPTTRKTVVKVDIQTSPHARQRKIHQTRSRSVSSDNMGETRKRVSSNCCVVEDDKKIIPIDSDSDCGLVIDLPESEQHPVETSPPMEARKPKKKRQSSRRTPVKKASLLPSHIPSLSSIESVFQDMEKITFTDEHFNISVHNLVNTLINPEHSSGVQQLLFHIIQHLHQTKRNPLIIYGYEQDTSELLPITEKCIVTALFQIEKKGKPQFHGLLDSAVVTLYNLVLGKEERFHMHGLASLCRVLTEICKRRNDADQPLKLCGELLKWQHQHACYLIASIIGVWKEAFQFTENEDEENHFFGAIGRALSKKPQKLSPSDWKHCKAIFAKLLPLPAILDKELPREVFYLIFKMRSKCLESTYVKDYLLITPMVIYAREKGFKWSRDALMEPFILPSLHKFTKEPTKIAFEFLLNLYAEVSFGFPNEENPSGLIKNFFSCGDNDDDFIPFISGIVLMKFSLWRQDVFSSELSEFIKKFETHAMVTALQSLFIRSRMKHEDFDVNDIIDSSV